MPIRASSTRFLPQERLLRAHTAPFAAAGFFGGAFSDEANCMNGYSTRTWRTAATAPTATMRTARSQQYVTPTPYGADAYASP